MEEGWRERLLPKDRLKRLALRIGRLTEKDQAQIRHEEEVTEMRRRAAVELYGICEKFVAAVNGLVEESAVELSPADFWLESFRDDRPNLFQINVRGRIVQLEFSAPDRLISTENFRVPYILEGSVRCFNQAFLDRDAIEEQSLFFCLEKNRRVWRYFNNRTYHTGVIEQDFLIGLLEQVL